MRGPEGSPQAPTLHWDTASKEVILNKQFKEGEKSMYQFNHVFGPGSSQVDLYQVRGASSPPPPGVPQNQNVISRTPGLLGSFVWYRPGLFQCRFRTGYIAKFMGLNRQISQALYMAGRGFDRMRFSVGARLPFKTTSMRPSDAIPVE
jgi:hypothetical protein